ncbi:MAG TPA: sugar phosphate isomerase/epimerase family protein [Acidimicrobiales bacterium]|nr:sugar phosphate isomerase/epimerase family protein [Acidimicrobiales bacterium]
MRFGVCAWSFSKAHHDAGRDIDPHTLAGLAELARGSGLSAVELSGAAIQDADPALVEELAAPDNGLTVIVDTGGEAPDQIAGNLDSALQAAALVHAPVVRTTISRCLEGDRSRFGLEGWREHLRELVVPLREAAKRAADQGTAVAVENHQDICSRELVQLCEDVDSPAFGVLMDCGNAFAVGETPAAFAERVLPYLKHVHLKDYVAHPTPSGWRLVRCPIGSGIVDFGQLVSRFDQAGLDLFGCIEIGATSARHIRMLEPEWWQGFDPRPWNENLDAIRGLHAAQQPPESEWQTPHERGAEPDELVAYEMEQYEKSVAFVTGLS